MARRSRSVLPFALALGLLVQYTAAEEVVSLDGASFEKHLQDNKHTLVEFYAPWCGHCKKLAPELEKAANILEEQQVKLAKLDATSEKDLAAKYGVKGFPTLLWFEDGQEVPFDGARTSDGIVQWVKSMMGPAVTNGMPGAPSKDKPQMILYADSLLPGFLDVAKVKRRKADWYFVEQQTRYPKVTVAHLGEDPVELTGYSCGDKEKVTKFLDEHMLPLYGPMDGDTFDKYMEAGQGLIWTMFPPEDGDLQTVVAKHRSMMEEVAKKFQGKYYVTYTDMDKFKEAIDNMLSVDKLPAIAVQKKAGDKKKYVYDGEMVAWKIAEFVKDVDIGKIEPKLKSEPVPPPTASAVKHVVGSTLKSEVFKPDKDVFLEVYAPWCGHCKKMQPEYEKLAAKIKKEDLSDLLSIAWIDGTANDSPVETMDWSGFPTLYFVKAGQDKPTLYEGERTAKGIWRYIRRHATKAEEIKERLARKTASENRGAEL
mmetsp:Transcript_118747/g.378703  ORF Transcript_118747/g.378703 Transcript_118747/m.378703 type:complete len:482 (-) Transcript_118747:217-1662(-)|eukprot:CAMPEP_0203937366 /NCGR_PEP_ID=MMETSP0359-20131031/74647_1 /ASSEMBLY_ACC=CAM_ASM_000338 /TAXON_ID=268821 /ORGANISM="Scrippsiella Hangoei, Strain SHTV-5" /LENGTH=481 /DNA_ID=CAMNT_0050867441 /DNA_START=41 /DNA_END=1486 /DNA_ORIENTATION=+